MSQTFQPGDFLVFQLEAGYGLLRVLAVDGAGEPVWHLTAYYDFFPDVDAAEAAAANPGSLTVALNHAALTNRAFESTQVARISNLPLNPDEIKPLRDWSDSPEPSVSDRSIRLLLGLR